MLDLLRKHIWRGKELFFKNVWRKRPPLSFLLALVCLCSRAISLLTPFELRLKQWIVDCYVLFWLAVLIALATAAPRTGVWGLVVASVALYRLQDLLFSMLDDALDLTGRFQQLEMTSKVIIALVNIMQVVLVFTIVIGVFTSPADWTNVSDLARFKCFALSWGGLIPFGVSANAAKTDAQVISIVESAVAVILLLVSLTRFLSLPSAAPSTTTTPADELAKLVALRDQGVLSSEEFERQKAKLLG